MGLAVASVPVADVAAKKDVPKRSRFHSYFRQRIVERNPLVLAVAAARKDVPKGFHFHSLSRLRTDERNRMAMADSHAAV